jgi:hypothetical protein
MTIVMQESEDTFESCYHWLQSRKKVDNTAAIISIQAEELTKTKVLNASQTIQGKAAGVQVISSDFG